MTSYMKQQFLASSLLPESFSVKPTSFKETQMNTSESGEQELRQDKPVGESLADIIDKHLAKEISDDEFEELVREQEYINLIHRSKEHGR